MSLEIWINAPVLGEKNSLFESTQQLHKNTQGECSDDCEHSYTKQSSLSEKNTQTSEKKGFRSCSSFTSVMWLHLNDKETKGFPKASLWMHQQKHKAAHNSKKKKKNIKMQRSFVILYHIQISTQLLTSYTPLFPWPSRSFDCVSEPVVPTVKSTGAATGQTVGGEEKSRKEKRRAKLSEWRGERENSSRSKSPLRKTLIGSSLVLTLPLTHDKCCSKPTATTPLLHKPHTHTGMRFCYCL